MRVPAISSACLARYYSGDLLNGSKCVVDIWEVPKTGGPKIDPNTR